MGDPASVVDAQVDETEPRTKEKVRSPLKTFCLSAVAVLGTTVNLSSLTFGIEAFIDCSDHTRIPFYLIASGVSGLTKLPFFIYFLVRTGDDLSLGEAAMKKTYHALIVLGLAIFLMGCVAVFNEIPILNPTGQKYCSPTSYYYAYGLILFIGATVLLIICSSIVAAVCNFLVCSVCCLRNT